MTKKPIKPVKMWVVVTKYGPVHRPSYTLEQAREECDRTNEQWVQPVLVTPVIRGEKEMKLTIIYADFYAVRCDLEHTQLWHEPSRRTISVELTPEQCAILAPRKVGVEYGSDRYEEIERIVFEDPPSPEQEKKP